MDFAGFFRRASDGLIPFAYQRALSESEQLPHILNVPTGAGKTAAVVLGWLWRRRFHSVASMRASTPRRLVYCLPTRVLVEQTITAAETWLRRLGLLATEPCERESVRVYRLMGGDVDDDWDVWPESDAILVGTQDQLVSRALNRGYAMSRNRWPVHCGMLNNDALWVFDEVQLMGPAFVTSLQLHGLRQKWGTAARSASLWMSATLEKSEFQSPDCDLSDLPGLTLGLSSADRQSPQLAKRLDASKPLRKCAETRTKKGKKDYPTRFASAVLGAHARGSRTLVVVNRVEIAQAVYGQLKRSAAKQATLPDLLLLHSRFRPAERRQLEQRLQCDPGEAGCIVVATQTVEAGVDISSRVLFTELAPWPSLVQRFGRCNRYGEFSGKDGAQVYWVDVDDDDSLPYTAEELSAARSLLRSLKDVGIAALSECTPPRPSTSANAMWQTLRATDFLDLFDTTPDLDGHDIDVSPYIRESDDLDVFVFWRHYDDKGLPEDASAPRPEELCPVNLARLRDAIGKSGKKLRPLVWDALDDKWAGIAASRLYPGMTVMLAAQDGCYTPNTGWDATATEPVEVLSAQGGKASDSYSADPSSHATGRAIALLRHSDDVAQEVQALMAAVEGLAAHAPELLQAARWHDVGKAHPVFQEWLRSGGVLAEGELWAKAPATLQTPKARPYFRHELASALAALQAGQGDLVAYLVAAHHGKIRMLIRSLAGEQRPDAGVRFARGVWEGDVLPEVDLGGGQACSETTLLLQVMELGESEFGPSWLARALKLRDELGPFRLAYLEAILRVADWRASAKEARGDD